MEGFVPLLVLKVLSDLSEPEAGEERETLFDFELAQSGE
jgi:hypothetical protein